MVGEERHGKAAHVARRIEADVIRRGWPVGASLGSEQELQQQYQVSRSVLREAVRLVEHHQVARMRRGPGGGLIVTAPDAGPATRAVVLYLEYLGFSIDELLAARVLLEPLAARLAAGSIDEAGITRLRNTVGGGLPRHSSEDFHVMLAESAGNPVLALFIDVLIRLTARYAVQSQPPQAHIGAAISQLAVDHAGIVEAVTAGDGARAQTLTEHHVQAVAGWLDKHHRPQLRRGIADRGVETTAPKKKMAEVLATAIHDDIVSDGWPVGAALGTEVELLQHYRVSRSVLREALRILEYHGIARARRGPGGGLFVTEPGQQASVDAVALYLEYRRPTRADLSLVRDAIEVNNVAHVVRRRGSAEVAGFLAAHTAVAGDGRDPHKAGLAEFFFHTDLAELAGNRVLNLFLRILIELFGRHWGSTMDPMPGPDDAADVYRAHARIVEAIRDGDTSIARHRSRRHLEALSSWWG
uniref:FadR/GntR family transcriptional regulator n=1 Tax=Mycolicibacterium mengxianglii TaxID=2736649 RepID=UPI001E2EB244